VKRSFEGCMFVTCLVEVQTVILVMITTAVLEWLYDESRRYVSMGKRYDPNACCLSGTRWGLETR